MFYFTLGEAQIQKYLGAKKLTSTLYLLINKYIIYKLEIAKSMGTFVVFEEDEELNGDNLKQMYLIDKFFIEYSTLLNNYKKLVRLES